MSSSSQGLELDPSASFSPAPSSTWKEEANHRLAAHRARRGGRTSQQAALPGMEERVESSRQSATKTVADRVAARYAQAPTYSEMLAAEARNAARAAEAAAVAAGEARDAAQAILVGLDVDMNEGLSDCPVESPIKQSRTEHSRPDTGRQARTSFAEVSESPVTKSHTVSQHVSSSAVWPKPASQAPVIAEVEEAFEEEPFAPIQPLPANLLEFPRELVAARKARPRLAEGPLREESDRSPGQSQLRIFEVESDSISTEAVVAPVLPGWSSIRLDAAPDVYANQHLGGTRQRSQAQNQQNIAQPHAAAAFDLPLQTASLEDRLMAATVDAALIAAGFLVFVFAFAACVAHPPMGKPTMIAAGVAFFAFAVIYQLLFFSFGHDTPGMRYAKIALCTFEDENPTRQAMRRRLGSLLLSASPLGIGILWACFDDDRLGWHDRMSRTYQRSYR